MIIVNGIIENLKHKSLKFEKQENEILDAPVLGFLSFNVLRNLPGILLK